uniref:Uncharacterized protein n=1 Tax=Anopheles maculatus TaxID=74869 RepID=A0A182T2I3_9DIPT
MKTSVKYMDVSVNLAATVVVVQRQQYVSNTADEHSDRETDPGRDGESSDEGVNVKRPSPDAKMTSGMEFGRSPDHHSELSQATAAAAAAAAAAVQFGANHPLGVLGNLTALNMNMPGLSGLASGLASGHHGDVLEKLKMQVRDMKVGALMGEQMAADFAALHAASSPFGAALAASAANGAANGMGMFGTGREESRGGNGGMSAGSGGGGGGGGAGSGGGSQSQTGSQNGGNFSFTLPNAPISKDGKLSGSPFNAG